MLRIYGLALALIGLFVLFLFGLPSLLDMHSDLADVTAVALAIVLAPAMCLLAALLVTNVTNKRKL